MNNKNFKGKVKLLYFLDFLFPTATAILPGAWLLAI